MKNTVLGILVLGVLFGTTASASALQLQRPVPYAADNDISDNIKTECQIGDQLADFVREYAGESVEFRDGPMDTTGGRVLQLENEDAVSIVNPFIGHEKYVKVRGTLWEDGHKVDRFKGRRNSMGGAFGGFKGSCSVLGRTVKALGEDIGGWLKAPKDGASLGD